MLANSRLILGLHPANERRRYKVTKSLFGWAQTKLNRHAMGCGYYLDLNRNVIIFAKFLLLAAPEAVILKISGEASDKNSVTMTTFPFQCMINYSLLIMMMIFMIYSILCIVIIHVLNYLFEIVAHKTRTNFKWCEWLMTTSFVECKCT